MMVIPDTPARCTRIGKRGLRPLTITLRGKAGYATWQITGGGRKLKNLRSGAQLPGDDLVLTIDLPLQRTAINLLSEHKEAAAVVMDVETGRSSSWRPSPLYNAMILYLA